MAYTPSLRINKPATGSNVDTWGEIVNSNMDRIEDAVAGMTNLTVSGDVALVYANDSTDQAHYAVLNITSGSGGRILLQPQKNVWIVRNGASGNVIVTINGVNTVTVMPGETSVVVCDGVSAVYSAGPNSDSTKAYVDAGVAAAKAYADSLAFETQEGNLPGQPGNSGRFLKTNGITPSWDYVTISDVPNLQTNLDAIRGFAIAAAAIL